MTDLVSRWFSTVGPSLPERTLHASPVRLAGTVIDLVRRSPQLRELAASPLMCALMCGVYLERGAASLSGADIYASFVDMLIERRDVERGLERQRLSRSVASIFLEDLAGYMLIRGFTELPRERVLERFAEVSATLTHDAPSSDAVLTALLMESSMLVEPEAGRIRFLHQTFLEFLAAQCFLHNDDLDLLIERAHEPVWRGHPRDGRCTGPAPAERGAAVPPAQPLRSRPAQAARPRRSAAGVRAQYPQARPRPSSQSRRRLAAGTRNSRRRRT